MLLLSLLLLLLLLLLPYYYYYYYYYYYHYHYHVLTRRHIINMHVMVNLQMNIKSISYVYKFKDTPMLPKGKYNGVEYPLEHTVTSFKVSFHFVSL